MKLEIIHKYFELCGIINLLNEVAVRIFKENEFVYSVDSKFKNPFFSKDVH